MAFIFAIMFYQFHGLPPASNDELANEELSTYMVKTSLCWAYEKGWLTSVPRLWISAA